MKSMFILGAIAAVGMAETAQFTNTSFTGPFSTGQTVPLMWTTGNGLPISLSIANSTWSNTLFNGRSVLPTNYDWVVAAMPGFASGTYRLSLDQLKGGSSKSPDFKVVMADQVSPSTTAPPVAGPTTTVTWVYWDHLCACTKTGTATGPLNTVWPTTTTTWWDDQCGCHKSAAVPVSTMAVANNYTIPAVPPMITTTSSPANSPGATTTGSATKSSFTGGCAGFKSSMLGMLSAFAVVAFL